MSGGSWLTSDAWVFAAIANDQPARTHTLVELIAIADGINHAVPTESEFTKAVGRLLSAGLIGADSAADQSSTGAEPGGGRKPAGSQHAGSAHERAEEGARHGPGREGGRSDISRPDANSG